MKVVDASVTNKLFLSTEAGSLIAADIFSRHVKKIEEIIVPDLLFYEVANTLATKVYIPHKEVAAFIRELYGLELNIVHFSNEDMEKAVEMAKKYRVSVYDATYAVLAKEKKCDLITADQKFVKKVNLPFVKLL